MHIQNLCTDPTRNQLFLCLQSQADGVTVGNYGDIFSFSESYCSANFKLLILIVDNRDGISGKTQVNRAGNFGSLCHQLFSGIIVRRHYYGHIGNCPQDAHIFNALMAGSVIGRCHSSVGAGNFYI